MRVSRTEKDGNKVPFLPPTSMTPLSHTKIKTPVAVPGGLDTAEVREIVDVFVRAFIADPYTAILSGRKTNAPDFMSVLKLKCRTCVFAALVGGDVFIAETTDTAAKIVGCAVWYGPGREVYDMTEQRLVVTSDMDYECRYKACFDAALGEGTELNSWTLETIGVDPKYHRMGVASLLVEAGIEKARLTNTPLCVECTTKPTTAAILQKSWIKPMPIHKGSDECQQEFISMKGEKFSLWILVLGEPGSLS
ncbi:hypothetical protein C8R45DRAFT_1223881 [Mycena sanguinolenta]|nr:hypothetical protein C8R45DRAFT_1223881 [Mycena sanguinolenta]